MILDKLNIFNYKTILPVAHYALFFPQKVTFSDFYADTQTQTQTDRYENITSSADVGLIKIEETRQKWTVAFTPTFSVAVSETKAPE